MFPQFRPFVLFVGLLALACGPAQQAPSGPTAQVDQPKDGGVLNVRVTGDPFDWDLADRGKSGPQNAGQAMAHNSLLGFNYGTDVQYDQLVLAPELAERWEASPDARSFTYHLRKGVRFADLPPVNGRELTAADVKWSFEYMSRTGQFKDAGLKKGQYDWMFEGLEAIETADPYTAVVRFKNGFAPFLQYSASDMNPVMPREIYEQDGHMHDRVAGSGPFQLDVGASQKGTRWVWKKNAGYWEQGRPYIDEVRWLVLADDAAALAAFQTKQLDIEGVIGSTIGFQKAETFRKANPGAVEYEHQTAPLHVYLNTRLAPLDDLRVRKALSLAMDREELLRVFTGGKGGLALAGAFPDTFTQEEIRGMLKYDPAEARRLLAEAGHTNGVEVELQYPGRYFGDEYVQTIELIQAQLKKVGFNLAFKSFDYADYANRRRKGDYWVSITSKYIEGDIDSYLFILHPTHRSNYAGVNDPRLTAMLEGQRREGDAARRREMVREAARYINDQVYGLALFYNVRYQFWHPYVKNYAPHFGYTGWPIIHTWLDK